VVLPPGIAGSPSLKALRKSMLAGRELSDVQLQRLADAGEGLAAARYAKRLEERKDPAYVDDAAHYYSIAVYQGRDFAIPRLLATLTAETAEFSAGRLRNIRGVLDRAARRGDARAAAGLAEILLQGAPFEADIPSARELLLVAAQAGDAKAAMKLALSHIQGEPGLPADPEAARPALELALASPDPGVRAMALALARQIPGAEALQAAVLPASDSADLDRSKRPPVRPPLKGDAP
jgi:TPR repeat protein